MAWLTPWAGVFAAAGAVPALLLLYFLKLRRPERVVSSTFLWKRAVRDHQVNAPFQRIRRNILLLIQLLAIGCLLIGLAGPVLRWNAQPAQRFVLLIDRSASMNATDGSGGTSRLDEARRQGRVLIDSLRGAAAGFGGSDQAMIIAFDRHAKVLCGFTSDKKQLADALDQVEPTDGPSSLAEALTLARAFAESPGADANNRSAEKPAQLELFSDGGISDLDQLVVAPGELNFHCIGESSDNVAIVAMQARRSYDKAEQVEVFAALANYGPADVDCDVELAIDGNVRSVRSVHIPARRSASPPDRSGRGQPGQVSVTFSLTHAGGGLVSVRQLRKDKLVADDAAWVVLPPPRRLAVLAVTAGDSALVGALRACPLAELKVVTPAQFEAMDPAAAGAAGGRYDLVVLENCPNVKLARGRYVILGEPPAELNLRATPGKPVGTARTDFRPIVDWQSQHPILEHVNLENVVAVRSWPMTLPRESTVLARFADGPAMALLGVNGGVQLVVAFDPTDSNWPFEASFVLFWYNATAFIGSELSQEEQSSLKVGSAIAVRAGGAGSSPARLTGPGGLAVDIPADSGSVYRFAGTHRVGVYTLAGPGAAGAASSAGRQFAVNLLDPAESDIQPARKIMLSGSKVAARETVVAASNQELWPWLVLIGLALVCLEWVVYNWRVRL